MNEAALIAQAKAKVRNTNRNVLRAELLSNFRSRAYQATAGDTFLYKETIKEFYTSQSYSEFNSLRTNLSFQVKSSGTTIFASTNQTDTIYVNLGGEIMDGALFIDPYTTFQNKTVLVVSVSLA